MERQMKKILIIDDDEDILETTAALLASEGFEVQSAPTVEEGMKKIDEISPDIVLLDIMFPEKKTRGFEAAGEIKAGHPDLPIIALTAINREYAFDFTKEDMQADAFLNKPVKTDQLIELIQRFID
jgi:two-component system response regulator VicR